MLHEIIFTLPILADASTQVDIPIGAILTGLLTFIQSFAGWGITAALWFVPAAFQPLVNMLRVDQLLNNAINFGVKSAIDAFGTSTWTVDVQNKIIADALQYAIDHGPKAIIDWAGGADSIRQKLEARLGDIIKEILVQEKPKVIIT